MGTASAEEYVRLFRAKAEQMGEFPDKIIISALTGTATRHRDDMSPHIVALLESMICDPNHPAKHKLPLCYLVDSIVKNVTEPYAELFERGLVRWFCSAYDVGDETMKKHLARVVATWEVQSVFSADKRKEIQRYMLTGLSVAPSSTTSAATPTTTPPTTVTAQPQPPLPMHIQPPLPAAPPAPAPAPAVTPAFPPPSLVPAPAPVAALPMPPPPPPPPPVQLMAAPAPAPVAVPAAPPDVQAMINSRMKNLLDQQLRELGESSNMTLDDLWRTNAELAGGFRLVAQAQVHEELGLPPPPPPPSVALPPAPQQHPLPQPPLPLPVPTQQHPPPQPQQLAVQLPLIVPSPAPGAAPGTAVGVSRSPPPWAAQLPPSQDFGRAVQLADEVVAGARGALDASVRGDAVGGQVQAAEAAGKAALLACLLGGDAAGASNGAGTHLANLDPLDIRALARANPAAVRRLYGEGFAFWCKQDGTRFSTQVQLDAHMDLLFRRKRARREQKGGASREWYCTGEQWMTDFGRLGVPVAGQGDNIGDGTGVEGVGGGGAGDDDSVDGEDGDPDGADTCVPADERFTKCRICGERFDMFYDNEEEEWMYRNACYLLVHGAGDWAGAADEDEDGGGGTGEGGEGAGGGGDDDEHGGDDGEHGGARKIIVHKLCLDVSGLRDREEIMWRDLMPGTPRQRKRPAGDAGLDEEGVAEEGEDDKVESWTDASAAVVNGGISHGGGGSDSGIGDALTAEGGPPLKRVKAEDEGEGGDGGDEMLEELASGDELIG